MKRHFVILCALLLSSPRDRVLSTLPLRVRATRERPWNLVDSRGETSRADLTITSYTTYLYLSPFISAHEDQLAADRDAATHSHLRRRSSGFPLLLLFLSSPFLAQNRMKLSRPGNESDAEGADGREIGREGGEREREVEGVVVKG